MTCCTSIKNMEEEFLTEVEAARNRWEEYRQQLVNTDRKPRRTTLPEKKEGEV